jgi:hypothetical protein
MRFAVSAGLLIVTVCFSAFGQEIDPVGFCPPPATVSACTTGTGLAGETIAIGTTSFGMFKNGNGGVPSNPWELLVAVPNDVGGAPTITNNGGDFTQVGLTADKGQFLPTTGVSLYTFAGTSGDGSMNTANLFGANEVNAFGSTPSFFEIFAYSFSPDIANNTPYSFSVGGSGLVAGTFLAAAGGTNPFTTPFTITGLVHGPNVPQVPEPGSIVLLATVGLIVGSVYRKRIHLN